MDWNDLGMGLSVGTVVGMVVGALIGLMFLLSCILSVVKAVRDRRDIKARIAAKRASQINGNGHAPGADNPSPNEGKRGRPNILIIHDGAREERVKKGMGPASLGSSPRYPSPGISSPEEQNSRHTESTTVAEVCHHSSLNSSPGVEDGGMGGARVGGNSARNGGCLLPGQISEMDNLEGEMSNPVDISGESVEYRRRWTSNNCDPSGIFTTFPVSCYLDEEHDSASEHARNNTRRNNTECYGPKGEDLQHRNISQSSLKYIAPDDTSITDARETSEKSPRRSAGKDSSTSFQGFTKSKKYSPHHAAAHGSEYQCAARYNPRRNSYAAAIAADPDWMDLTPQVRRHSDKARYTSNSPQPLHKDKMRMRSHSREGADNPAFDAADDKMAT